MAAKIKNRHVYGTPEFLKQVKEEIDWNGRNDTEMLDEGHLVVYALPRKTKKNTKKKIERARREEAELNEELQEERRLEDLRRRKAERNRG